MINYNFDYDEYIEAYNEGYSDAMARLYLERKSPAQRRRRKNRIATGHLPQASPWKNATTVKNMRDIKDNEPSTSVAVRGSGTVQALNEPKVTNKRPKPDSRQLPSNTSVHNNTSGKTDQATHEPTRNSSSSSRRSNPPLNDNRSGQLSLPGPTNNKKSHKLRNGLIAGGAATAAAGAVGGALLYKRNKNKAATTAERKGIINTIISFIKSLFKAIINTFKKMIVKFKVKAALMKYDKLVKANPKLATKKVTVQVMGSDGKPKKVKCTVREALKYADNGVSEFDKDLLKDCNTITKKMTAGASERSAIGAAVKRISLRNKIICGTIGTLGVAAAGGVGARAGYEQHINNQETRLLNDEMRNQKDIAGIKTREYMQKIKDSGRPMDAEMVDDIKKNLKSFVDGYTDAADAAIKRAQSATKGNIFRKLNVSEQQKDVAQYKDVDTDTFVDQQLASKGIVY